MVQVDIAYEGNLRCRATHGDSGTMLMTDAPKDNQGQGESFSPTDLVGTALGTCMLTTMAIAGRRINYEMGKCTVRVRKEMVADPARRIGKLTVEVHGPKQASHEQRTKLQEAALGCPVFKSINPNIQAPVEFFWDM